MSGSVLVVRRYVRLPVWPGREVALTARRRTKNCRRAGVCHRRIHTDPKNFDALIFGYYEGTRLIYVARTRNGFTPRSREDLFARFRGLETAECPFANLPEAKSGRSGQGLTAAKMAECRWLNPMLVGRFEFVECTPDNHLRHSRFFGLREDKKAREVRKES